MIRGHKTMLDRDLAVLYGVTTKRLNEQVRRTHLRRHGNILKLLLVHAAAGNLGLWMRTLTGIETPRGLQGRLAAVLAICFALWVLLRDRA